MENGVAFAELNFDQIFLFDEARDYEPTQEQSFAAQARAKGMDPHAFLYDALTAGSGERFAVMYFTNYADHNLDAVREMQLHPETVTGLSDAGAHVTVIFDAVAPTYELTHWGRDRTRGETLPLEHLVHRQTQRNAQLFGFKDRGALLPGLRADVNWIDFKRLSLGDLEVRRDLPAGGREFSSMPRAIGAPGSLGCGPGRRMRTRVPDLDGSCGVSGEAGRSAEALA